MRKYLILLLSALLPLLSSASVTVGNLRTENLCDPLGIDTRTPRVSWTSHSDKDNTVQKSYHIIMASSEEKALRNEGDLWDSGEVESSQQLWIPYAGTSLKSNQRVWWRVRITTNHGKSPWSDIATFGIGLLGDSQWGSRWIGLERLTPGDTTGLHTRLAARYLRKEFQLKKEVKRATVYISGLGLYELYINGSRVGDQVLAPVPTDYRRSVMYNAFDVTGMLLQDANAVGIILGNGRMFPMRQNKPYKIPVFGFPKCRFEMIVEYRDGSTEKVRSDESWKVTADGPIRSNNEYDGEYYDSRKELGDWTHAGYDDTQWQKAERTDIPTGELHGQMTPNMTIVEELRPQHVIAHAGKTIVDFGQNMAGWVTIRVHGAAGDTLRLRYAEKLDSDGGLYTANLRDARCEDIYICNGRESGALWHPTFVYHGFRYVEVPAGYTAADLTAQVVSDQMEVTGRFNCSDTILNKIHHNALWGIRSNYKGMPIDCPQRNERQPWLGDRTAGSLGESFLFDNERLYSKWTRDICESQRADGCIPDVAPAFWNYYSDDVSWPAALPFSCDMLWEQYGNLQPIRDSYPYIEKWINHIVGEYAQDGIVGHDKYGDWCVPPERLELIHSQDKDRITDGSLISTAYTIRVLRLMSKFATLLGKDDAAAWDARAQAMTEAFNKKFLTCRPGTSLVPGHPLYPDSIYYGNNTATSNLLALAFGLVDTEHKDAVIKNVVSNIITKNNGQVSCGVIGISWLLRTLSDNGFSDVAYLLATNKKYPSWGYMVENGATTIWELWNGDKADPAMNSANHVMLLGDLMTWCYEYLGGIRPGAPGYSKIILKPDFTIEDNFGADVSHQTPYGQVSSRYTKTLEHVDWTVEIPCNTTAEVYLPDATVKVVGSGTHHFNVAIPTASAAILDDEFVYEHATFPQCHASTILELPNGDLLASYFGGLHENNPDVCIWVSRKPKGASVWEAPVLAGDGVFLLGTRDADIAGINDSTTLASSGPIIPRQDWDTAKMRRKACWNPVLYQMPDGEIWLFYKIGLRVADWTGWLVRSRDGGKTWSEREPLPAGFLGPIKNKPELVNDRVVCPSSTEVGGWKIHFEIYDLKTKEWKYVGPIDAEDALLSKDILTPEAHPRPIDCIQPSILKHKDGRLQVLCRSRNQKLATSFSSDGGDTWSTVTLTDVPNNQSGTDAVTLHDGRHILIYNDFQTLDGENKGVRTPLSIAVSDDGLHWRHVLTLEDSPISQYSYPAIIQGKDGSLHCTYTWRRQKVAYKRIDATKIK